jgi:hypothetical protein
MLIVQHRRTVEGCPVLECTGHEDLGAPDIYLLSGYILDVGEV